MLGIREPEHYGSVTYAQLVDMVEKHGAEINTEVICRQTNHEGVLVDWIQEAYFEGADGIVINPGAYTHTSIALLDALKSVKLPTVEVHISKVAEREEFRKISYLRAACVKTVSGHGINGYLEAMDFLVTEIAPGGNVCK
jgi:3-dehydroquinate dehydratase-2